MAQYEEFFDLLRYVRERGRLLSDEEEDTLQDLLGRDGMCGPIKRLAEQDVDSMLLIVQDEIQGVRYTPITIERLVNTYDQNRKFAKRESDRYLFQKQ